MAVHERIQSSGIGAKGFRFRVRASASAKRRGPVKVARRRGIGMLRIARLSGQTLSPRWKLLTDTER